MMMHRKNEHISEVKGCKKIQAGINCQKGPVYCWYRHDLRVPTTTGNSRSTWGPITTAPAFNVENFPYGPTPPEGNGGTGQGGAPNDLPNITAGANGSHDGQNNEDEKINDINEDEEKK